jgi:hypothetical protein
LYIGKNLLKRNIWPISIKVGAHISCMMGIQVYSNEIQVLFKGGMITKVQNRVGSIKYFLLMNNSTIKAQIYTSAS